MTMQCLYSSDRSLNYYGVVLIPAAAHPPTPTQTQLKPRPHVAKQQQPRTAPRAAGRLRDSRFLSGMRRQQRSHQASSACSPGQSSPLGRIGPSSGPWTVDNMHASRGFPGLSRPPLKLVVSWYPAVSDANGECLLVSSWFSGRPRCRRRERQRRPPPSCVPQAGKSEFRIPEEARCWLLIR